jgi:putative ABC transport system permease protein
MQLILSGVFHIDVPPGNVPLAEVQKLAQNPLVAQLIPLSMGDSFRAFRIVGTDARYVHHYQAQLAQGQLWEQPMQAVLGAQVAQSTGLAVGGSFIGTHGLGAGEHAHGDNPYTVTGVLAPCACVLDRLILTATESVWKVHETATALDPSDEEERQALEDDREITMALVRYRSPLAAVTFPRYVNSSTNMQAAAPAQEVSRLLLMVGVGTDVLRGFAWVLLATAGLSLFIALWSAVRERRFDLAMLRMLGAPAHRVAGLLLCEAWWLALMASVAGLLLGHVLAGLAGQMLQAQRSLAVTGWIWLSAEWWILAGALVVATLAASLPAWNVYRRVDVLSLLNNP